MSKKTNLSFFSYSNPVGLLFKINISYRAVSKIRSYDDFVPYYHQFIEQMANLLGKKKIFFLFQKFK
jgi:hypothetical protein